MEKHCYKNYEHIIAVLTTEYGFRYTDIGNNGEECFHKDSKESETVYVHPMLCSYWVNGVCRARFKSDFGDQAQQRTAFSQLCAFLDKHTEKCRVILAKENIAQKLKTLERKREELVAMALNPEFDIKSKQVIPVIYENLIGYQSALSYLMAFMR